MAASSTRAAAEAACRALRERVGGAGAPIDLGAIATAAGVASVRIEDIPIDGMLVPETSDRYAVVVARRTSPTRKRFTLAHEIGHLVLGMSAGSCFVRAARADSNEDAADAFASELLLPRAQLAYIAETVPSLAVIVSLAGAYRVSPESVALRLIELNIWRALVIRWSHLDRPGGSRKLRVDWSARPADLRIYVPRWTPAPVEVADWWSTSEASSGTVGHVRSRLKVGSLRGEHLLELVRVGEGVLSLVRT